MKHMVLLGASIMGHDWVNKSLIATQPGVIAHIDKHFCTLTQHHGVLFGTRDEIIAEITRLVDEGIEKITSVPSYVKGAEANASLESNMSHPLRKLV